MNDRPDDGPPPQAPRSEPEILPPERRDPRWTGHDAQTRARGSGVFITVDEHGHTRYTTFKPPGPFTIWLVLIVIGLVGAAILMLALGFVLFLIPVVAIAIAALVLSGSIRAWWRRVGRTD
jgi:hypothetical protein